MLRNRLQPDVFFHARNVLKFDSWGAFGQQFWKEYFTCREYTPFLGPACCVRKGRLWSVSRCIMALLPRLLDPPDSQALDLQLLFNIY